MQRRRFRARMQLHASDEEPTGRCEGRGWRCHKELSLKPGRRQIAHVNAAACQSAHELGDDIVWTLNDAVNTYRHSHDRTEEMRLVLLPIAREILQDIDEWLEGERGGTGDCDAVQIELAAHLEGGKAECVLTPYRCTKGNWRKRQPWKIEVADEHDEPIATVLRPGTTAALLVGHLAAFVAQVDVAEPRVPEVAVVPHG